MKVRLKHERLAQELARSRLTLNGWARRLGLRSGHLSQLANGRRVHPTARTREKLLRGLSLEFDDLFEIEQPEAPETRPAPPAGFSDLGSPVPRPRTRRQRSSKESPVREWLRAPWTEIRSACLNLARHPAFTSVALVNLAVGLGVCFALFRFVYAVAFQPYDYREPERLVDVRARVVENPGSTSSFSWLDLRDLAERVEGWLDLAAWDWEPVSLAGGSRPLRLGSAYVTANFADVVGVPMVKGRWFTEEERRSAQPVAVLSAGLWREAFASDPAIVGRVVSMDGRPTTIVGVASRTLDVPDDARLWRPLAPSEEPDGRASRWLRAFGRLAPDRDLEQVEAWADEQMQAIGELHPEQSAGLGVDLRTIRRSRVASERNYYLSILVVVGILMLMIAANLASLLLTRTVTRGDEMAVRRALGASRLRLVRGLFTENAVLAAVGAAMALVAGSLLFRLLMGLVPDGNLPTWLDTDLDQRVVFGGVLMTLVTVLLASVVPLTRATATPRVRSASAAAGVGRLRAVITVVQVALCTILLVAAGLFVSNLLRLSDVDSGLREDGAHVVGLDLLSTRTAPPTERRQRFLAIRDALLTVPGVEAVGAIDRLPLSGGWNTVLVTVETPGVESYDPTLQHSLVTPGYFRASGIELLEGTDFSEAEARDLSSRGVDGEGGDGRHVVVSRSFAEEVWPAGSAVGRRIKFARPDDEAPWYTIRGVVPEVRHHGLDRGPTRGVYRTEASYAMSRSAWVLRSDAPPAAVAEAVRRVVAEVDPTQPIHQLEPLAVHVDRALWMQRLFTVVFWAFAALAAVLAALGLYGVLAYGVSLRRRELGIRMAVGASGRRIARLVVASAARMVGTGLLLGVPLAVLAGRFLAETLRRDTGGSGLLPAVVVATVLLVAVIGVASALLPSRRAGRIAPTEVLRS